MPLGSFAAWVAQVPWRDRRPAWNSSLLVKSLYPTAAMQMGLSVPELRERLPSWSGPMAGILARRERNFVVPSFLVRGISRMPLGADYVIGHVSPTWVFRRREPPINGPRRPAARPVRPRIEPHLLREVDALRLHNRCRNLGVAIPRAW